MQSTKLVTTIPEKILVSLLSILFLEKKIKNINKEHRNAHIGIYKLCTRTTYPILF
jgi:hypothetical protein